MVRRSQLANGLRVVTEELSVLPSVSIGIWVENGSRFETAERNGVSHFIEHLLFKGTERRTARQIAEAMDGVGGVLNAFTGKECTCYYARVLHEHSALALDVLSDLFLHSRFDEEEIERERSVVLQEISQIEDTPEEYIDDLFNRRYWGDHPVARPVCGSAETVRGLTRRNILDFLAARYRPDQIIIAAAGHCRHEPMVEWAARQFGSLAGFAGQDGSEPPQALPVMDTVEKPLEQVHICVGVPGVARASEQRFAAHLLTTALGGGMSSRLFQEIRERRGRAYSVYSFLASFRDAGYLGIYAATSAEWVDEVITLILAEVQRLAREGLGVAEISRVRNQLKGGMLLGLETSDARMSRIARNEIFLGEDLPLDQVAARIDATTNEEIVALAEATLCSDRMGVVLLGDLAGRPAGVTTLPLAG